MICLLTTTIGIIGAANAPQRPAPVTEVSAASAPAAPVLLAVPDVVGLGDPAAREALRAAGFTEVVLGPASAPIEGPAPGTVTAQSPAGAALAAAGTVITLTEAGAPALVPTQPAAPLIAGAGVDAGVDADVDVDRPSVPARPLVAAPPAPRAATPAPRPRPAPAPKPAPQGETPSSGGAAYYANCAAARSAGAAPISAGQPGYRPALDRNDDGVACE